MSTIRLEASGLRSLWVWPTTPLQGNRRAKLPLPSHIARGGNPFEPSLLPPRSTNESSLEDALDSLEERREAITIRMMTYKQRLVV